MEILVYGLVILPEKEATSPVRCCIQCCFEGCLALCSLNLCRLH
jgi:hypothetical protein